MDWVAFTAIVAVSAVIVSVMTAVILFWQLRHAQKELNDRRIQMEVQAQIGGVVVPILELTNRATTLLDDARSVEKQAQQYIDRMSSLSQEAELQQSEFLQLLSTRESEASENLNAILAESHRVLENIRSARDDAESDASAVRQLFTEAQLTEQVLSILRDLQNEASFNEQWRDLNFRGMAAGEADDFRVWNIVAIAEHPDVIRTLIIEVKAIAGSDQRMML